MPKDLKPLGTANLVMKDTGILLVQHGDFPFDFIEKQPEMYHRIESVMQRLSEASKKLDHSPEEDPHAADTRKLADMLRVAGYDVEIGYLDFALPTIAEAVAALKVRGHKKIIFANSPGLMMRSSHSLIDIPAVLETIRAKEPDLELIYAKPGGPLPLIARAIGKKINAALGESYVSVTACAERFPPGHCRGAGRPRRRAAGLRPEEQGRDAGRRAARRKVVRDGTGVAPERAERP